MLDISNFYKTEKTSGQTVWPIKIKTVVVFYLISLQTSFVALTIF